jgi:hypothetical protein
MGAVLSADLSKRLEIIASFSVTLQTHALTGA